MGKRERYNQQRVLDSYQTYLRYHDEWRNKGYTMYDPVSKSTYVTYYRLATSRGDKNIAREFAKQGRHVSYKEAYKLYKYHIDRYEALREEYEKRGLDPDTAPKPSIESPRMLTRITKDTVPGAATPREALFLLFYYDEMELGKDSNMARQTIEDVLYE
jgi:hypothetical protein